MTSAQGALFPAPPTRRRRPARTLTSKADATELRWRKDFTNASDAIPESWLIRDGDWTGISADHRDEPIVRIYHQIMIVGYARGWIS